MEPDAPNTELSALDLEFLPEEWEESFLSLLTGCDWVVSEVAEIVALKVASGQ